MSTVLLTCSRTIQDIAVRCRMWHNYFPNTGTKSLSITSGHQDDVIEV